jgi:hypothetical protein
MAGSTDGCFSIRYWSQLLGDVRQREVYKLELLIFCVAGYSDDRIVELELETSGNWGPAGFARLSL